MPELASSEDELLSDVERDILVHPADYERGVAYLDSHFSLTAVQRAVKREEKRQRKEAEAIRTSREREFQRLKHKPAAELTAFDRQELAGLEKWFREQAARAKDPPAEPVVSAIPSRDAWQVRRVVRAINHLLERKRRPRTSEEQQAVLLLAVWLWDLHASKKHRHFRIFGDTASPVWLRTVLHDQARRAAWMMLVKKALEDVREKRATASTQGNGHLGGTALSPESNVETVSRSPTQLTSNQAIVLKTGSVENPRRRK